VVLDIQQKQQRLNVSAFITHELYNIIKAMLVNDAVDFIHYQIPIRMRLFRSCCC
jgi:hypothetical protein